MARDDDDFVTLGSGIVKNDFKVRIGRAKMKGEATKMNVVVAPDVWAEFGAFYNATSPIATVKVAYSQKQQTLRVEPDTGGAIAVRERGNAKAVKPFTFSVLIPPGITFKDADRYGAKHEVEDGKLYITMPLGTVEQRERITAKYDTAPATTFAQRAVGAVADGGRMFRQASTIPPARDARLDNSGRLPSDPPPGRSALDEKRAGIKR
ncbi:MAG: hypothetical protein JWN75_1244 [Candidatus Saccharibacteria bacterium]|nr:hypothetical protein [Candidatus Saccharibacteria bacterium]